jgi:hypothetical protein
MDLDTEWWGMDYFSFEELGIYSVSFGGPPVG